MIRNTAGEYSSDLFQLLASADLHLCRWLQATNLNWPFTAVSQHHKASFDMVFIYIIMHNGYPENDLL